MKRNAIIAILISFCFTASIFMVIPTRSANQPYDPWVDYDGNGIIGLTDLQMLANSYGTTGDPTKNVNVTNWSQNYYLIAVYGINASWGADGVVGVDIPQTASGVPTVFYVGGFSRMTVLVGVENMSAGNYSLNMGLQLINWFGTPSNGPPYGYIIDDNGYYFNTTIWRNAYNWQVYTANENVMETKGAYANLQFMVTAPNSPGWAVLDFFIYLRNE